MRGELSGWLAPAVLVWCQLLSGCSTNGSGGAAGDEGAGQLPEVRDNPPAPASETILVTWLPLPPTAPANIDGSVIEGGCANPTGCIDPGYQGIWEGPSFMWDNEHVLLPIQFSGAPPGSVYTGQQVIAVKTGAGKTFANGDAWKCISCGVPDDQQRGRNAAVDHPQAFFDGTRVLAGRNIISCGKHRVTDASCTPAQTHIYPLVSPTTTSEFFSPREPRLSPDDVTLGFSQFSTNAAGITQFCYLGRLEYIEKPTPQYRLADVRRLLTLQPEQQTWHIDPDDSSRLLFNPATPSCGELRGFTSDGRKVVSLNSPAESNHVDLFLTDIATGQAERLTRTEYIDPIKMSPDDEWFVGLDVHVSRRSHFVAAMDGLLPVNDSHTIASVSAIRNNGDRRFFQPMLVDRYGQRGNYQGQQLNAGGDTGAGGVSDPNWNARADPAWSPDGTRVVYWQSLVTAPDCGGDNPLPCPASMEPGGRRSRLMLAELLDRQPLPLRSRPTNRPEPGDWTMPFVPGETLPVLPVPPAGTYTIAGSISGTATITIALDSAGRSVKATSVTYKDYANDCRVYNGAESVDSEDASVFGGTAVWDFNIEMTGCSTGSKITYTADGNRGPMEMATGGSDYRATGTLVTELGSDVFNQPEDGT